MSHTLPNVYETTVAITDPEERVLDGIRRFSGFVKVREMIDIITALDLDANPRSAKRSSVTDEIIDTIHSTPKLYPFKSKGILLGTSTYGAQTKEEGAQGSRQVFGLTFKNRTSEGILDGGHNTLAIALYLMSEAILTFEDSKAINEYQRKLKRVKTWAQMKELWNELLPQIEGLRHKATPSHDAYVPLELLVPSDTVEVDSFLNNILLICAARNNNVQLKQETLANQDGVFEYLKGVLEDKKPVVAQEVIWKTNSEGSIALPHLISLVWIPLGAINFADISENIGITPLSGTTAYSSKSESVKRFKDLITGKNGEETNKSAVAYKDVDGQKNEWVITNSLVKSAIDMVPDVLDIYDYVYENYANAYNSNKGRFGGIDAVKNESRQRKNRITPFGRKELADDASIPPLGYIMPVIYGLRELIEVDSEGKLVWSVDPHEFYRENLNEIVGSIMGNIKDVNFDPQKVGKGASAYEQVTSKVKALYADKKNELLLKRLAELEGK